MPEKEQLSSHSRIKLMHTQEAVLRNYNRRAVSKFETARKNITKNAELEYLRKTDQKIKDALDLASKALMKMQIEEENPILKKIHLQKMDGKPVWVVGYEDDGRWGIVDVRNETIVFPTIDSNGELEYCAWHYDGYIFRYEKKIRDYSAYLKKYEIDFQSEVNEWDSHYIQTEFSGGINMEYNSSYPVGTPHNPDRSIPLPKIQSPNMDISICIIPESDEIDDIINEGVDLAAGLGFGRDVGSIHIDKVPPNDAVHLVPIKLVRMEKEKPDALGYFLYEQIHYWGKAIKNPKLCSLYFYSKDNEMYICVL